MKTVRIVALVSLLVLPVGARLARAADAPTPDQSQIRSLLLMGRSKEALPMAEAAAKAAPQDASAQLLYGKALTGNQRAKEAVPVLTAATTLDPKSTEAFIALGDAHLARLGLELGDWLKKHQNALVGQIHSEVKTVQPGGPGNPAELLDEVNINDRSAAQMNGKEWEHFTDIAKGALAAYNGALALDPAHKAATRGRGVSQLVLGEWKDSAAMFEKAGVPPFDSFLFELARNIYDAHAMGGEALRIWAKAEESDPTNAWAYWYQRALYDELRHSDWRYGYFDAMCKLYNNRIKDDREAHNYTPKDALKDLQGITEKQADFAPGWRGRGIAAMAVKDLKQARTAFEKAVALQPNDWFSQLQLGVLQLNEKDPATAQQTLAKAAKGNPESAIAWHALGTAAERNKDLDAAVSYYERAADLAPGWAEAHYSLGALLLDRRQGAESLPHLQRYLELDPKAANAKEVQSAVDQLKKILAAQS